MSAFLYKTIANERPQGKPNVYFACHPVDREKYFEEYAQKILKIQDCAVWYESKPEEVYDEEDLQLRLSQMQLFVMPVTTKLLTAPNRAMDVEFPFAQEKHIPVLPLMMEQGLDDVFSRRFGDLQYLDPNNTDDTKRSFDEVLSAYIRSTLVSNELAEKVRAAFDAYIFLSYRKKDRKMAQDLMRLIHRNPVCRDIAIWYDEFLTPGEDFNQAIEEMLEKSDLFALAVTPNLVNEPNYVMTTEYPAALAQKKPVLPVEMEATDRSALNEHYEELPPVVQAEDGESLREALVEKLKALAITANDADPQHNFLIGLAYLDGIDVEVNSGRALELISGAAEAGVPEAMQQLVVMYETGKGVARDYRQGIEWRKRYAAVLREVYKAKPDKYSAAALFYELEALGDAQFDVRLLEDAEKSYEEMRGLAERFAASENVDSQISLGIAYERLGATRKEMGDFSAAQEFARKSFLIADSLAKTSGTVVSRRNLSVSLERLGNLARASGDFYAAEKYFRQSLAIREQLVKETETVQARKDLALNYDILGDIARENNDLDGAWEQYVKNFEICEALADADPSPNMLKNLSTAYFHLGDVLMSKGALPLAQGNFKKSVEINISLAEMTGTIEVRRNLSIGYHRLGSICKSFGDLEKAWEFYEKEYLLSKQLADETGTLESYIDLAGSYIKLGEMMELTGSTFSAQDYYEKSAALQESAAKQSRAINIRRGLLVSYHKLADLAAAQGDLGAAQEYYEKRIAVNESLITDISSVRYLYNLAVICYNDGLFCLNQLKNPDKAKAMFERVTELGENCYLPKLEELKEKARRILKKHFS